MASIRGTASALGNGACFSPTGALPAATEVKGVSRV